jgi:hypothetical protein
MKLVNGNFSFADRFNTLSDWISNEIPGTQDDMCDVVFVSKSTLKRLVDDVEEVANQNGVKLIRNKKGKIKYRFRPKGKLHIVVLVTWEPEEA